MENQFRLMYLCIHDVECNEPHVLPAGQFCHPFDRPYLKLTKMQLIKQSVSKLESIRGGCKFLDAQGWGFSKVSLAWLSQWDFLQVTVSLVTHSLCDNWLHSHTNSSYLVAQVNDSFALTTSKSFPISIHNDCFLRKWEARWVIA